MPLNGKGVTEELKKENLKILETNTDGNTIYQNL